MTCFDYNWNMQFDGMDEERTLAHKYITHVNMEADEVKTDAFFWDYFNHILEQKTFDEKLYGLMEKIHKEERDKNGIGSKTSK